MNCVLTVLGAALPVALAVRGTTVIENGAFNARIGSRTIHCEIRGSGH